MMKQLDIHLTLMFCENHMKKIQASWSSGNVFVSAAEGPKFKCRAGQFEHSVANGNFIKGAMLPERNDAEIDPANS